MPEETLVTAPEAALQETAQVTRQEKVAPLSLAEMARRVAILQALKQHHEAIAKMASSQMAKMAPVLNDMFADAGIGEVRIAAKRPDGTLVFDDGQDRIVKPVTDYKPYCKVEMRPMFFAWMRENGFGALIKEEIHHASLSSWVEERIENKKALPPAQLLTVTELDTVAITKARQKALKKGVDANE
jgi:hypothetical protein